MENLSRPRLPEDDYRDVAVVMITRNEELAVGKVIDDAFTALPGAEVFVIDGSTDDTPKIAQEHGATAIREPGGGPAPALLCALRASSRPIVVTVDADDTYPPDIYPVLIAAIRSGADVAGTDRLGHRPPSTMPLVNWLANIAFNVIASLRTRRRLRDVHSGQRAYRRSLIDEFEWDIAGPAFPVDLLLWPAAAGRSIREFPIPYRDRIGETTLSRGESGRYTMKRLLRTLPKKSARSS